MLSKLSRETPIGAMLLFTSGLLAILSSPDAVSMLFVHLLLAGLLLLMFKRAARAGNFIVVVQVAVVFLFSLFCAYVLTRVDVVAAEPTFVFSVFTSEGIKRALMLNDFGLGIMLLVYGVHAKMQRPSSLLSSEGWGGNRIPIMPPSFFVAGLYLSWGVILWSVFRTPNVLHFPYPDNNVQPGAPPPTFRAILVLATFALFLIKFVQDRFRTSFMGFVLRMTTYASILSVGLLGGSRGSAVGLLIGLITLDNTQIRDGSYRKWLLVSVDSLLAVFAVFNWPFMRYWISNIGLFPAFVSSFSSYEFLFSTKSISTSMFLSDFPMLGQSLFHFLYVIALVDSGTSLHYQTFLNLIPQQLPEFLDGILWIRPINDNWLLADQFHQNGGFYTFANAYWNGGVLALGLFSGIIAWVIARIEILFKPLPAYYGAAYFMLIFLIPVGFYYGVQGLVRGIEFGLIAYLFTRVAEKVIAHSRRAHSKRHPSPMPANLRRVQ